MNDRAQHLHDTVSGHAPADDSERRRRDLILALLADSPDPFDRKRFDPGHITASAFVVSPDGEKVIQIFHDKLARWLQPGGHVDPADCDARAAAVREVAEEVTLSLSVDDALLFDCDVHDIPASRHEPPHLHHDVRFLFIAAEEQLEAGEGVSHARWVPVSEFAATADDEGLRRVGRKLKAHFEPDAQ